MAPTWAVPRLLTINQSVKQIQLKKPNFETDFENENFAISVFKTQSPKQKIQVRPGSHA